MKRAVWAGQGATAESDTLTGGHPGDDPYPKGISKGLIWISNCKFVSANRPLPCESDRGKPVLACPSYFWSDADPKNQ
jgi:hypothetical protein